MENHQFFPSFSISSTSVDQAWFKPWQSLLFFLSLSLFFPLLISSSFFSPLCSSPFPTFSYFFSFFFFFHFLSFFYFLLSSSLFSLFHTFLSPGFFSFFSSTFPPQFSLTSSLLFFSPLISSIFALQYLFIYLLTEG